MMSPCSPPSALLAAEGPPPLKSTEFHGLMSALGRWECSCASLSGGQFDTVPCSAEGLWHHLWSSGTWSGDPFGGPFMGCVTLSAVEKLFPGSGALSWAPLHTRGWTITATHQRLSNTHPKLLCPHPLVVGLCQPGSWQPWGSGLHPEGIRLMLWECPHP